MGIHLRSQPPRYHCPLDYAINGQIFNNDKPDSQIGILKIHFRKFLLHVVVSKASRTDSIFSDLFDHTLKHSYIRLYSSPLPGISILRTSLCRWDQLDSVEPGGLNVYAPSQISSGGLQRRKNHRPVAHMIEYFSSDKGKCSAFTRKAELGHRSADTVSGNSNVETFSVI